MTPGASCRARNYLQTPRNNNMKFPEQRICYHGDESESYRCLMKVDIAVVLRAQTNGMKLRDIFHLIFHRCLLYATSITNSCFLLFVHLHFRPTCQGAGKLNYIISNLRNIDRYTLEQNLALFSINSIHSVLSNVFELTTVSRYINAVKCLRPNIWQMSCSNRPFEDPIIKNRVYVHVRLFFKQIYR